MAQTRTRTRTARSSSPNPPNKVDPGWTHESIANLTLRLGRSLAGKNGMDVNVGTLKSVDEIVPASTQEPVDLLARIYAHMGHRIPVVRSFEKRLEGKELKAGVASDTLALLIQFYTRNETVILGDLLPTITRIIRNLKNQNESGFSPFTAKPKTSAGDDDVIIAPPGFFDNDNPGVTNAS